MIRLCDSGLVRRAVKQPEARRVSLTRKPFPLYYHRPVPTKVYLWVYKVTLFLYKTLRIALETRPGGACSTLPVPTCLHSLT